MRDLRGQVSPHTGTTCVKGLLSLQRQKPSSLVSVWGTSLSSHPSSGSGVPVCSVGLPGRATSSSSDLPSQSSRWEAPGQPRVHSFHTHLPPPPPPHTCTHSLTHWALTAILRLQWEWETIVGQFSPILTLTTRSAGRTQKFKVRVPNKAALTSGARWKWGPQATHTNSAANMTPLRG